MKGNMCSAQKVCKKLSSIWMVLIVALLSSMFVIACDATPGINNNGNNNGANNGNSNNSPSNSCNGVNNCNTINNSNSASGSTSNGGNVSSGTSQQSSGSSSTSQIAEGDFLRSPGPVSGPAIVEYWNGLGGAGRVCGTFQLPTGESFNYKAGHWWRYNSDQDVQALWSLHVALYKQKSENTGCSIGQRPGS